MKGPRSSRVVIAATILATLFVPAVVSSAGSRNDLEKTQSELSRVRQQLESKRTLAGDTKAQIRALESAINRLQIEINKLDADIARVQADVVEVRARIEATQARIDAVEDRATAQAVLLYKSDDADTIAALLESKSLAELDRRVELLGIAAEENTGALIEYGRLKVEIQQQNQELLAKKAELSTDRKVRGDKLAELDASKKTLDARYARLAGDIDHLDNREGDLAAEAAALRDEIVAAQAQRSVSSLGESGAGFIWPLNGPVTSGYGSRWGRMHTGIDIDGYTGQPIVASKGGRVILASSYSGYGNTVIVDHGGGISTLYAHLSGFNTSSGAAAGQGQVIGYVGCTGSCTGDHLHFEVRVNGSPVDPMVSPLTVLSARRYA
ncbi:MAG: murein hydrolase activator EnvC family protein [Actinomycetota bacterium]